MKLSLVANAALCPLLSRLLAESSNEIALTPLPEDPVLSRRALRGHLARAAGFDALVLAEGTDNFPEDLSCELPVIHPHVHNAAALLLGDERYRALFRQYDGGLAFMLPGTARPFFPSAPGDCACLCAIDAGCFPDTALTARILAQANEWDFFEEPADLGLLRRLLDAAL